MDTEIRKLEREADQGDETAIQKLDAITTRRTGLTREERARESHYYVHKLSLGRNSVLHAAKRTRIEITHLQFTNLEEGGVQSLSNLTLIVNDKALFVYCVPPGNSIILDPMSTILCQEFVIDSTGPNCYARVVYRVVENVPRH